jgi:hypothetical protein
VATKRPTTSELAASIAIIEQRTADLLQALDAIQEAAGIENDKMWTALRGVAGLDGLSTGMAAFDDTMHSSTDEISRAIIRNARKIRGGIRGGAADIQAVLAPLQALAPASTALPLEDGVPEALTEIRVAVGVIGSSRTTNFPNMTTDWDGPVDFIGQAQPSAGPPPPQPNPYPNPGPFPPPYGEPDPDPYDGDMPVDVVILTDEEQSS